MSVTTNSTNLKYSITILFSIIVGMTIYIVQKNKQQNTITSSLLVDKSEKNATLKDLEFLKSKYDEVISENVSLSDEVSLERQKIITLISELKGNKSSLYYKQKLADAKAKMVALLENNFKRKDVKINYSLNKPDTIYTSYDKLVKQNKNLQKQNNDLTEVVKKGGFLSISNLTATTFKVKNSGKLIVSTYAKKANFLKVKYTINANAIAKNEEKTFYIQIIDPNNNVVGERKSQEPKPEELVYTFSKTVDYSGQEIEIDQSLPFDSFMKGKYYITIFDFNGVVGKSSFIMK